MPTFTNHSAEAYCSVTGRALLSSRTAVLPGFALKSFFLRPTVYAFLDRWVDSVLKKKRLTVRYGTDG